MMDTKSILAMPEEVIRHIFSYLTDAEVYFKLRCICCQFREITESYVQLGRRFNKKFSFLGLYLLYVKRFEGRHRSVA